jgi:uncharacterized protein YgiB involved in biofilm formation
VKPIIGLAALTLLIGCQKQDNFGEVYRYADECADRRTDELFRRVAAQDVPNEQLKRIVDECLAEAQQVRGRR